MGLARISSNWWWLRRATLLGLLCVELVSFRLPFNFPPQLLDEGSLAFPFLVLKGARAGLVTAAFVVILLSWREVTSELSVARAQTRGERTMRWLILHLGLAAVLAMGTALRNRTEFSATEMRVCAVLWALMGLAALIAWCLAFLPPSFWIRWFRGSRREFIYGLLTGSAALVLGGRMEMLWPLLQKSTFWMVAIILRTVSQPLTIVDPALSLIGTPQFVVNIAPGCSGIEGMALICTFLVAYLFFYRHQLRFPHALLLLPVGVAAAWLLNATRIAALIVLGNRFPIAAVQGFHSVAGWILFNLLTCGLIWGSWRLGLFVDSDLVQPASARTNSEPASSRLAPFLAMIATAMLARMVAPGLNLGYPLEMLVGAVVMWFYRFEIAPINWKSSGVAVTLGTVAFALWIALAGNGPGLKIESALAGASSLGTVIWACMWITGAVLIVPVIEELAFRDYLRRKLITSEFETVALGRFTWISFLGSSVLFGAFSGQWLAGTAVGMVFALAVCRRGVLSDAILAHATSNALRCAYALAAGKLLLSH